MPVDSHVHKIFEALKRQGHSVESAARIAQYVTGDSLQTGEPAKHHENCESEHFKNGVRRGNEYLRGLGLWVEDAVKD